MLKSISLLIVDDEESILKLFERLARKERLSCVGVKSGYEAIDLIGKNEVECVLLDINLPSYSGFQVLEYIKSSKPLTEVVLITGDGTVESAVKALKMGAYDYLTKPLEPLDRAMVTVNNAIEKYRLAKKVQELEKNQEPLDVFQGLLGSSSSMQELYSLINSIRDSSSSVLIEGESGTGKEMVAKAIHRTSQRAHKPFLVVNCAAIPEGLLESELFGHTKGAFTGAVYDKRGLFEEANDGTLFLDEIGEISLNFQVKLLRILQEGEFRRVGDSTLRHTDVRIIAATNKNLKQLIHAKTFREDLYYRLHVIGIHLSPLRDRRQDIPLLTYHFLAKYNQKLEKNVREISLEAMQVLQSYAWIGNVRELENVMERSMVFARGETIQIKDLPAYLYSKTFHFNEQEENHFSEYCYKDAKNRALTAFHQSYLHHLLKETKGNISLASNHAKIDRSNLKKIIKKYDINTSEFKKE